MTPQEELVREVARGMAEKANTAPHGFDGGPDNWDPYAKAAIAIVVERAAGVIAGLPTGRSEDVMEGHEEAYRAVSALAEEQT